MSELVFDEVAHTYTLGGIRLPSVTQLLKPITEPELEAIPAPIRAKHLDRKRAIGVAVHAASELIDAGIAIDPDSIDEAVAPYLDAYRRFLDECRPQWTASERRLYHPELGYAGTLDRSGLLERLGRIATVDLKTTAAVSIAVGIQTAAYHELALVNGLTIPQAERFALQLRPDGTYRLIPQVNPLDWPAFRGLLALHAWRASNAQ